MKTRRRGANESVIRFEESPHGGSWSRDRLEESDTRFSEIMDSYRATLRTHRAERDSFLLPLLLLVSSLSSSRPSPPLFLPVRFLRLGSFAVRAAVFRAASRGNVVGGGKDSRLVSHDARCGKRARPGRFEGLLIGHGLRTDSRFIPVPEEFRSSQESCDFSPIDVPLRRFGMVLIKRGGVRIKLLARDWDCCIPRDIRRTVSRIRRESRAEQDNIMNYSTMKNKVSARK